MLIECTEGNPLFLEESVRTLIETGALIGVRGAYRPGRAIQEIEMPATVQAVLGARIDRLAAEDKRLLQTAAVLGKDVPYLLLHRIAELPETDLRDGLARLQTAEFLYEATIFPDLEFTFKHALTHDVAYASLLQDRRRDLHARIVAAIETLYSDRLDEQAERLAHHALYAEAWEKALRYLRQAAHKAATRWAFRESSRYLDRALDVAQRLPQNHDVIEQSIAIRLDLRNVLLPQMGQRRIAEILPTAVTLAEQIGDRRGLIWALGYTAHITIESFTDSPDVNYAISSGHRALELAQELGDPVLIASARHFLVGVYHTLGQYKEAIRIGLDAAHAGEELIAKRTGPWSLGHHSMVSSTVLRANRGLH